MNAVTIKSFANARSNNTSGQDFPSSFPLLSPTPGLSLSLSLALALAPLVFRSPVICIGVHIKEYK